jgi:large subunit ribosomal protein L33
MREIITLQCSTCKRRNYSTTRNKKTQTEKLEVKKFCPFCRAHTKHKETKGRTARAGKPPGRGTGRRSTATERRCR